MLSDEVIKALTERLVNRIEEGNTYVLKKIAKDMSRLRGLTPADAQKLAQIMKYGGDYDKIVKKLSEILEMNVEDIYKIFEEVAKKDQQFAKKFYKFRNKKFIPYQENKELQEQVRALAKATAKTYMNISNTKVIGFNVKDINGTTIFKGLKKAYFDAIDTAVINVAQGKTIFDDEVRKMMKELGSSGIKTANYASGRSIRLDSAIRMDMQGALRDMHTELQLQFGEEYGADGIEISVHSAPADDHADLQGRQFSTVKPSKNKKSEWEKLQSGQTAKDYNGNVYEPQIITEKGVVINRRPISQLNCYHYTYAIVLGVQEQNYTDKQLQNIIDENNKGFEFEGKHYTKYQGEQLQRKLETEIRKQKDIQIMAKNSGDKELLYMSQKRIDMLTNKYNELSNISGLGRKAENLRVSGYRKTKIKKD